MQSIVLLLLLTAFAACNPNKGSHHPAAGSYAGIQDMPSYFNSFTKTGFMDTIHYTPENTVYKPLDFMEAMDSPFYSIDTFTQAGSKYRLVYEHPSTGNEATLEKHINGQWIRRIALDKFNGSEEIGYSIDVNHDGYTDLTRATKWFTEVHFFDSTKKDFIDTVGAVIYDGAIPIDTMQHIFCDIHEFRQLCGQIHTQLFTLTHFKRTNLFDVELYNCSEQSNTDSHFITKLMLSKCYSRKRHIPSLDEDSLVAIKTIQLTKPIKIDKDYEPHYSYFDYATFWKAIYRKLMSN